MIARLRTFAGSPITCPSATPRSPPTSSPDFHAGGHAPWRASRLKSIRLKVGEHAVAVDGLLLIEPPAPSSLLPEEVAMPRYQSPYDPASAAEEPRAPLYEKKGTSLT